MIDSVAEAQDIDEQDLRADRKLRKSISKKKRQSKKIEGIQRG